MEQDGQTNSQGQRAGRKRVLYTGDGGQNKYLSETLAAKGVDVDFRVSFIPRSLPAIQRHLRFAALALKAVFARKNYDLVFFWQQYVCIYYHFFSQLFRWSERDYCVYYIIFRDIGGLKGKLKRAVFMSMVGSRHAKVPIFVNSTDALYSSVPKNKARIVNNIYQRSDYIESRLLEAEQPGKYYFCGGWSNRDYEAYKRLAELMPESRFVLACPEAAAKRLTPVPANLEVVSDRFNDDFRALIVNSKALVMPIVDPNVMSGQLVSLQAMQSGKPVFISRNTFIGEWIKDLDSVGFLEMYDTLESLRDRLSSLDDAALREKGSEGRRYLLTHFTQEAFFDKLANIIAETLSQQKAQ